MVKAEKVTPDNLRLAFRVEGDWWKAYAAPMGTMDGAVLLGSIGMKAASISSIKEAFMELMKDIVNEYLRDAGVVTTGWNDPQRAPESERSGRA